MGYKLLGFVTWKGAKWFLRRKYAVARAPKPVLGGVLLVLILAAVAAAVKRPALHR